MVLFPDRPALASALLRLDSLGVRIEMGTRALDLEGLLAEAPPPPHARPVGVRIGHVHLRALDLAAAERFWVDDVGLDLTLRYRRVASFLSAGGYHHHIGVNRFAQWTRRVAGAPGLAGIEMEVEPDGSDGGDAARARAAGRAELVTPEGIAVAVRRVAR